MRKHRNLSSYVPLIGLGIGGHAFGEGIEAVAVSRTYDIWGNPIIDVLYAAIGLVASGYYAYEVFRRVPSRRPSKSAQEPAKQPG